MSKMTRALHVRIQAGSVRLVKAGLAAVAATLCVPAQSISNWLKAEQEGKFGGAGTKPVSPEQRELSRLRAEVARLKMERDIRKKRARTSRRSRREVSAYRAQMAITGPISVLCEVLDVSPSGFHQRRQRTA